MFYDPIILAPSFAIRGGELCEGKSIGTAKLQDLELSKDLRKAHAYHAAKFAKHRQIGHTVGRRKLREVQGRVEAGLNGLIDKYYRGKLEDKALRDRATEMMKVAWGEVFQAGLRAGGVPGQGPGAEAMVKLGPGDDVWLKSAMQHEMRFFNGMLKAVMENTAVMPLPRRVHMYAESLNSFYQSARVIALPADSVIHWVGPDDERTCPGCIYLFEHSPYTKHNLPTVPQAGSCQCLTNCRDHLYIRRATQEEAQALIESHKYSRDAHIRNLRRIRSNGHV